MLTTAPRPTRVRPALVIEAPLRPPRARPVLLVSDDVLVVRAASGDDRAFGELMRRHSALLHGVVHGILRSSSDADDVVQETFIAAWTRLDNVLDGAAIVGWLVTTARRRSYDRLRGAGRKRPADLEDTLPAAVEHAPDAVAERASLVAEARRVLDRMPAVQRRCWELRHLRGSSYDEIGRALGVPKSTVRGLLARARLVLETDLALWR